MTALDRLLRPLWRRVNSMVGRAVLRAVYDADALQGVQIEARAGELLDRVERFQEYGFTSVPLAGAEAAIVSLGGIRQHSLAVAVDDRRYRPTGLAGGEACVYTLLDADDEAGPHRIHLLADGKIRIETGAASIELSDTKCIIDAATIELRGAQKTLVVP